VTGLGPDAAAARERAYEAARMIEFDGMQMRTDIAARAVERAAAL
jgi:phosphoribosylamine---glycine ligase